jgi:hypothetical protein
MSQGGPIDHPVPEHQMGIGDVDVFFDRVLRLCHMNPRAFLRFLNETGREMLTRVTEYSGGWLP